MNEGIWRRPKGGLTHPYGLKVDISCGDLDGNAWYRTRSGLRRERRHTSKEVPNMLSLTKDMSLAEEEWRGGRGEMGRDGGEKRDNEECVGEEEERARSCTKESRDGGSGHMASLDQSTDQDAATSDYISELLDISLLSPIHLLSSPSPPPHPPHS